MRKEPNSQRSAFSRKDYRIYLYHTFDLIFQHITHFVELSSQWSALKTGIECVHDIWDAPYYASLMQHGFAAWEAYRYMITLRIRKRLSHVRSAFHSLVQPQINRF